MFDHCPSYSVIVNYNTAPQASFFNFFSCPLLNAYQTRLDPGETEVSRLRPAAVGLRRAKEDRSRESVAGVLDRAGFDEALFKLRVEVR